MKIYDITAEISDNLPRYNKKDVVEVKKILQLKNGDTCNLSAISMSLHTGTHADMPYHFFDSATATHNTMLEYFYGQAKLFRLNITSSQITKEDLLPLNINEGDIILLDVGQSPYMQNPILKKDYIVPTAQAAEYLVEKKIRTLGLDYLSADAYGGSTYPVHEILLGNNIAILEGLVLENIPQGEYIISALPLKIKNGEGSPVRAILIEN